jgi:hypothetical protein
MRNKEEKQHRIKASDLKHWAKDKRKRFEEKFGFYTTYEEELLRRRLDKIDRKHKSRK